MEHGSITWIPNEEAAGTTQVLLPALELPLYGQARSMEVDDSEDEDGDDTMNGDDSDDNVSAERYDECVHNVGVVTWKSSDSLFELEAICPNCKVCALSFISLSCAFDFCFISVFTMVYMCLCVVTKRKPPAHKVICICLHAYVGYVADKKAEQGVMCFVPWFCGDCRKTSWPASTVKMNEVEKTIEELM